MIRAVLDANVIISALFWKGPPFMILKRAIKGDFLFLISPNILKEIEERLILKFKVPEEKTEEYLRILIINSQILFPTKKLNVVKEDPTDNIIVECAFEGKANFIVSGDIHLKRLKQYRGIKIISPREFLEKLK